MRRFIIKFILLASPLFLILVGVNYFGDAANLFKSEYEEKMASIVMNDNYVTNIGNYDERIFQKKVVNKMDSAPKILVFGSSRTMLINTDFFPNQTLYNNSVSGASLEDIIGLFQIYNEHDLLPEKIILGVDPWLFNKNNGQSRWKSIRNFYNDYHNNFESKLEGEKIYQYKQLFQLSYFQASVKSLARKTVRNSEPMSTKRKYNSTNTKLVDGSLAYKSAYRNASQAEINSKIESYVQGKIYSIENFKDVSDDLWNEFQAFIHGLRNDGISVEFFLCPYAPLVFDRVSKNYPNVIKTENIINDFAKDNEIKVHGSFNPYKLGFNESFFYDGMHCKEKGIEMILENELKSR